MEFFKHHSKRFIYPLRGIIYALRTDRSFRFQFYGIGFAITFALFILQPMTHTDVLFLFLAYTLILITELQNSAFEAALDRIHPEHHHDIGLSKDMAAGAVLLAGFFLLFVLVSIYLS